MMPFLAFFALLAAAPAVELIPAEAERRVEVRIDGQPFTSYLWPASLAKPVLWPVRTARGTAITRDLPPGPGGATDHPHHVGLWFNYGDVDGIDYWGNSEELRKKEPARKVGTIVHRAVKSARGGELVTAADWVGPDGKAALREETRFVFSGGDGRRAIDRVATLTAAAPARFFDNKEGMLALRLRRALELPSKANGQAGTGQYRSSEGKLGDDVWGTRARWVMLTASLGAEPVTVAILDHPKNPGHPTYWHARGYGLFAANPLGAKVFSKGTETLDFKLGKGKSARFAYRVVILSRHAKPDDIEAEYRAWAKR